MYQPIANYGVIGNMRTCALAGMHGSIDWFCFPDVDSPSVFGAILDDRKGGRFRIAPVDESVQRKQFYWPSTNILVTRFFNDEGIVELRDFMPLRRGAPVQTAIYRSVRCVRGKVHLRVTCVPAFDYGRQSHEVQICGNGARFISPALSLCLSASVPLRRIDDGGAGADFLLKEREAALFILKGADEVAPAEDREEAIFTETVHYWRSWLAACCYRGRWREQVQRSVLMLKLLTYQPTGAIIAAPTCSLPEVIGGTRNWDYRYAWIRDAAFTVYAFLRLGFREEASAFIEWLMTHVGKDALREEHSPTLLTVRGEAHVPEITLDHWEGYKGSGPVRIGNAASAQFQSDIYGEAMDSLYLYNKYVTPISYDFWMRIRHRMDWICENWQRPDNGIWEMRGDPRQFVYSKVMNWVALDRGIRLADKRSFPADRARWIGARDAIYEEVLTKGWNPKLKAFTQSYGSDALDASLLVMPLVFFMAPTDPRMLGTLDAILKDPRDGGLTSDNLVHRYPSGNDDLSGEEGTFNMCSFWLAEALVRAGQRDAERLEQGRIIFERMLGYANHVGLYAEQTSSQGEAIGNFPQAFTHLALISAAFNLDRHLGNHP
ncbi:MAG TPA: glycoside hydrolase family 15 protein [Chthoniobacteraceae bacterium]|jgi:GH15 family glucan-1,4-alpha-glucosidase|nr:glycoside hydrolase family 15 protein [Chthoniobacteraceae bacterium]